MNYLTTMKAALDAAFAGICQDLGLEREEAYQTIRRLVATMS
jgi:hypothetical protein